MIETDKNETHGKRNEVNSGWRQIQHKKTKTSTGSGRKMSGTTTNESKGEGVTLSQVGCIDLQSMFQTKKANKVFHLARILKDFLAAGKAFDQDF
jgi:hypothetical protein